MSRGHPAMSYRSLPVLRRSLPVSCLLFGRKEWRDRRGGAPPLGGRSQDWSHVLGELRLGDRRGGGAGERAPGALEAELTSSVVRTDVEVTERACPRTPDVRTCGRSVGLHVTRGRSMT